MGNGNRTENFIGIFLISLAVLLFEISLTRLFSFILFSNYAFMIISTALFGFGLSGVLLSVFPNFLKTVKIQRILFVSSVLFSLSVLGSFLVINYVPLQMSDFTNVRNLIGLGVWYVSLIIPFCFAGLIIAALFSLYTQDISKLYFFDLVGAGIGCVLTVPFFVRFGALGTLYIVALLGIVAGMVFTWRTSKLTRYGSPVVIAVFVLMFPSWMKLEIQVHDNKRSYKADQQGKVLEYSKWSSLSKIDIAPGPLPYFKRLWIDGGTNESALISFDGTFHTDYVNGMNGMIIAIPYLIKKSPDVAIIGSSGGREVLLALNNDPRHVTAIEMDPAICDVVSNTYSQYIGNIFKDPRVTLVCDEGRSFIKRSKVKFDIIQQINNFTPIAMASGAINLSESYLLTVEAFNEYLEHLKDDGMLVINRHNSFKLVIMARSVLERLGLDPKQHLVVIQGEDGLTNGFFLKKSPFRAEEVEEIRQLATGRALLYYPGMQDPKSWYVQVLTTPTPESFYHLKGLNLEVPTDNKPFFEHVGAVGRIDLSDPDMPPGLKWIDSIKKFKRTIPIEDLIMMVIFLEATFFAVFFILGPLVVFNNKGIQSVTEFKTLGFFFAVGIAFILIEICLMQNFVLFLGVPVYSISVVLFSLLSASGLGALLTDRIKEVRHQHVLAAIAGIFVCILGLNYLLPLGIAFFLGYPFNIRVLASMVFIFPLGVCMGMPFPLAMRLLNAAEKRLVPWAWGINGYATVIGTVSAIVLARGVGFRYVFFIAGLIYLLGYFCIKNLRVGNAEISR